MKKLTLITLVTLAILLTACGKKTDIVSYDVAAETESSIAVSVTEDPDITMEEFYALEYTPFCDWIDAHLPNYKEVLKMPADTDITVLNYSEIKSLVGQFLWDKAYVAYEASQNTEEEISQVEKQRKLSDQYTNELSKEELMLYYGPTVEYIESLSTREYAEWLTKAVAVVYGVDDADFMSLSDEEIEAIRTKHLSNPTWFSLREDTDLINHSSFDDSDFQNVDLWGTESEETNETETVTETDTLEE